MRRHHLELDFPTLGASGAQWGDESPPLANGKQMVCMAVLCFCRGGISRVGGGGEASFQSSLLPARCCELEDHFSSGGGSRHQAGS